MNSDMKRRTFIGTVVGTLVAAPLAARFLFRKRAVSDAHRFTEELQKYQNLVHVPIHSIPGPSSFQLTLAPQAGSEMRYVMFAPSHFPKDISYALGDEPDEFVARDGSLVVEQSNKGQVLILGKDAFNLTSSPLQTEDRDKLDIQLLVKENRLTLAKRKGQETPSTLDTQFMHQWHCRRIWSSCIV